MSRVVVLASLALMACRSHSLEDASKCGLTETQLKEAMDEVSRMKPYSGKEFGRCDLIVDDGHTVLVITPEIQRSVENMIARERAEAKK